MGTSDLTTFTYLLFDYPMSPTNQFYTLDSCRMEIKKLGTENGTRLPLLKTSAMDKLAGHKVKL